MNNVIEAPFASQGGHGGKPDDDDQTPLCGTDSEGAFVAELDHYLAAFGSNRMKEGNRWCGACLKVAGFCSNAHPITSKCSRCQRPICNSQGCKHGFHITLVITPVFAPEKSTGGEVICISCADKDQPR